MSYNMSISLILGTSQIGLSLSGQLFDTTGTNFGSVITTGFVEIGTGSYLFNLTVPDNFRGGVKIFPSSDSSNILTIVSINPEEIENSLKNTESLIELENKVNLIEENVSTIENIVNTTPKQINIEVPQIVSKGSSIVLNTGTVSSNSNIEIKTGVRP